MNTLRFLIVAGLTSASLIGGSGSAQAAACTGVSIGTSTTTDLTLGGFASDQCVISTVNPQSGPTGDTSGFSGSFGAGAWSLLSKVTSSPTAASFGGVNFNITFAQASGTSGAWSITADQNVTFDLVFAMHAANRSGAFLFDDQALVANAATPGSWAIKWVNNGDQVPDYSNLTLFIRDVVTTPIPEPSTYALLIAGLSAIGLVARRRRA